MLHKLAKEYAHTGAYQVWKSWHDKMVEQGRHINPELQELPIPKIDMELDETIAAEVADDFLNWLKVHEHDMDGFADTILHG